LISKRHTRVTTGVFIPGEFLSQAEITEGDIEIAVANKEIRIYPAKSNVEKKVFSFDSPLWECVGFVEREGINGNEHDRYIYDEER
jgi:hypothetical protein